MDAAGLIMPDLTLPAEVECLRHSAGLVRRAPWSWVLTGGADREAYLHRMTSQVVQGLATGHAVYGCVLTPKGKVLGDPLLWNLGDTIALDMDARAAAHAIPALERYVITDDVTFEDLSDAMARFVLVGPAAPERLAAAGVEGPQSGLLAPTVLAGETAYVLRRDLGSLPAFEWVVPVSVAGELAGFLGTTEVSQEAYDTIRVVERVPAYGHELDLDTMPLEARLEDVAVAFGKGCYPGQEPVVMAHHRGKPAKLLVQVVLDTPGEAAEGMPLLRDARPVGRLTTLAAGGVGEGPHALAMVRHALAREGEELALEGGGRAVVSAAPGAPHSA